ncbi:MAG: hypothetical protein H6774_00020 [Pseudomonadales bacterium]|nr:hypothetical protein [Pseudomonadales bacterium]
MNKTQLFQEMRNQGLDEEVVNALMEDLADLPEELGEAEMKRVDAALAQVEEAAAFAEYAHGKIADALEQAEDGMMDANDRMVEDVAGATVTNVKLAQDVIKSAESVGDNTPQAASTPSAPPAMATPPMEMPAMPAPSATDVPSDGAPAMPQADVTMGEVN